MAAAKAMGKDRELKAILEHTIANYLDHNSELYEQIEKQNREEILDSVIRNLYEHDILEINKCLSNIVKEITRYMNGEYFTEDEEKNNNNVTYFNLIHSDKKLQITDKIKPLTFTSIAQFLSVYVNEEISRKIPQHNRGVFQIISDDYLYTKKSDIFPELTKRIKILIKRLSN